MSDLDLIEWLKRESAWSNFKGYPVAAKRLLDLAESLESQQQRIAELEAQLKELRNLREVDRVSDQSIELTFSSCRACSAFCKVIERIKE